VRAHFGVPRELSSMTIEADMTLLATERRDIVAENDCVWPTLPRSMLERIEIWPWRRAREEWLGMFEELS
jgi:hypothetical protein